MNMTVMLVKMMMMMMVTDDDENDDHNDDDEYDRTQLLPMKYDGSDDSDDATGDERTMVMTINMTEDGKQ